MNNVALKLIASTIHDHDALQRTLAPIADASAKRGTWGYMAAKFLRFLETGNPEFTVIAKGNSKLPFLAFSALPFVSCPGMGACSAFCYSIKAWRYPAAFFRQMQNSVLLQSDAGREHIKASMRAWLNKRAFRKQSAVDFRLYVDGDFDSVETMDFWFNDMLPEFPQLRAYGYSKSFSVFRAYTGAWPVNYVLNLSSGSKYDSDADMLAFMRSLPIVRGQFIALQIEGQWSAAKGDYRTKAYRDTLRAAADAAGLGKIFVCPGRCGECTGAGHACGNPNLNVPIAIGIH